MGASHQKCSDQTIKKKLQEKKQTTKKDHLGEKAKWGPETNNKSHVERKNENTSRKDGL